MHKSLSYYLDPQAAFTESVQLHHLLFVVPNGVEVTVGG